MKNQTHVSMNGCMGFLLSTHGIVIRFTQGEEKYAGSCICVFLMLLFPLSTSAENIKVVLAYGEAYLCEETKPSEAKAIA